MKKEEKDFIRKFECIFLRNILLNFIEVDRIVCMNVTSDMTGLSIIAQDLSRLRVPFSQKSENKRTYGGYIKFTSKNETFVHLFSFLTNGALSNAK